VKSKILAAALAACFANPAAADAVTDWNRRGSDLITEAKLGTPPAVRVMAVMQTAVCEAVEAAKGASAEAAVAAASRTTLVAMMPAQQSSIEAAYTNALAAIAEGRAKADGIAAGEKAAAAVLARRSADAKLAGEQYRPHTAAGVYVPTMLPAATQWPARKPWVMASAADFRPGPPPALTSEAVGARFRGGEDAGRQSQRAPHGRAIGHRAFLGVLAAGDLLRRRAVGRRHAGPGHRPQCAALHGDRAGDG
jgi:hypothetical protein